MPGMKCPNCGQLTFFETPTGKKCSKCAYTMIRPLGTDGASKGGRGKLCSNCGRFTVFNQKCTSCGARYKEG